MGVTLQRIIREGFPDYARRRRLPLHVHQAARAIAQCRTAAMGGHIERCPEGHTQRVHYNSCRHRACPRCGRQRLDAWLADRTAELLPCDHFHVIVSVQPGAWWTGAGRCALERRLSRSRRRAGPGRSAPSTAAA